MSVSEIIFVRGGKTHEDTPWKFFHFHPTNNISVNGLQLTYFDYPNKEIKIWNRFEESKFRFKKNFKLPTPTSVKNMSPLIETRDSDLNIDKSQKLPTVLMLYDYIKAAADDSVRSLQIFSHGDYDGPIIWNFVFENDKDLNSNRDAHDTEFRKKDFFGSNPLAGSEGKKFKSKFTKNSFIKIYGCNEDQKYRKKLITYYKSKDPKEKSTIEKIYKDEMKETYAYFLSRTTGLEVWGAPLGWGTNPWPGKGEKYRGVFPPKIGDNWWIVSKHFRNHRKEKYLDFYEKILNAPIDSGRYVGYSTKWLK